MQTQVSSSAKRCRLKQRQSRAACSAGGVAASSKWTSRKRHLSFSCKMRVGGSSPTSGVETPSYHQPTAMRSKRKNGKLFLTASLVASSVQHQIMKHKLASFALILIWFPALLCAQTSAVVYV